MVRYIIEILLEKMSDKLGTPVFLFANFCFSRFYLLVFKIWQSQNFETIA